MLVSACVSMNKVPVTGCPVFSIDGEKDKVIGDALHSTVSKLFRVMMISWSCNVCYLLVASMSINNGPPTKPVGRVLLNVLSKGWDFDIFFF